MPHNASDNTTLRWAVRTYGDSGFLFVNNYERITTLSDKEQVSLSCHNCVSKRIKQL